MRSGDEGRSPDEAIFANVLSMHNDMVKAMFAPIRPARFAPIQPAGEAKEEAARKRKPGKATARRRRRSDVDEGTSVQAREIEQARGGAEDSAPGDLGMSRVTRRYEPGRSLAPR